MATLTFYPSAHNSGWTNSQYGYANDTSYAYTSPAKNNSKIVQYSGFNIDSSIPPYATINSVTLYVNWKISSNSYSYDSLTAQIYINNVAYSYAIATTSLTTTLKTDSVIITGLTMSDLQNSAFKVYITAKRGGTNTTYTAYLNVTYVVVDYNASLNAIEIPTDLYNTIDVNMLNSNLNYSAQKNPILIPTDLYNTIHSNFYQQHFIKISTEKKPTELYNIVNNNMYQDINIITTKPSVFLNSTVISSNTEFKIPIVKWSKKIDVLNTSLNIDTYHDSIQCLVGTTKQPSNIISNVNINVPIVIWDKDIISTPMIANTNVSVNIDVKIYRKPPTMVANVFMNNCKDMHLGSQDNPYLVSTLADLQALTGKTLSSPYNWYALTNDIDGGNVTISPINTFTGHFEGNGYTIKNLTIQQLSSNNYTGLFTSIGNQIVRNLNLTGITLIKAVSSSMNYYGCGIVCGSSMGGKILNVHVSNCTISNTPSYSGGLVGYVTDSVWISSCSVESMNIDASMYGGLVGYITKYAEIQCSYTLGNVVVPSTHSMSYGGGLIGYSFTGSSYYINNCYSKMNFTKGGTYSISYCGGFVGRDFGTNCKIADSYYAGSCIAGNYCYGLVGYDDSTTCSIINSFVDKNLIGINEIYIDYGQSRTTNEMKIMDTFTNWGFPWVIDLSVNDGYPSYNFNTTNPFQPKTCTVNTSIYINKATIKKDGLSDIVYYNFGESLPSGSTVTNYGGISDPLVSGKGAVFGNTTHVDSTTCTATIPVSFNFNGEVLIEYLLSSESSYDKGKITYDGTVVFYASGYTSANVATTSNNNTIVVGKWAIFRLQVTAGSHTIKIDYSKDGSASNGKDTFSIGRIYTEHFLFLSDKNQTSSELTVDNYMRVFTVGCGEVQDFKPKTSMLYSFPRLPVAKVLNCFNLDFSTDPLPTGATVNNFMLTDDASSSKIGRVLRSVNYDTNSVASIVIPVNIIKTADMSIQYFFSSYTNDLFYIIFDGITKLAVWGNGSVNVVTNTDTTTNPNSNIHSNAWNTYIIKNVSQGNHTIEFRYALNSDGYTSGYNCGEVSKITCGTGINYIYNAVFNGIVPKIVSNNDIIKDNILLYTANYLNSPLCTINWNMGNHSLIYDNIMKLASTILINADMYTEVNYFHIINALLALIGEDNESIILKW